MIRKTIIIFLIILGWTALLGAIAVNAKADSVVIFEVPVDALDAQACERGWPKIARDFERYAQGILEQNRRDLRRMKEVH